MDPFFIFILRRTAAGEGRRRPCSPRTVAENGGDRGAIPTSSKIAAMNPIRWLLAGAVLLASAAAAQPPAATPGALDRIRQAGTVVIGYRENAVPFSFLRPSGDHAGYSIDLCKAIVEEIAGSLGRKDLRTEYRRVTPTNRLDEVVAG